MTVVLMEGNPKRYLLFPLGLCRDQHATAGACSLPAGIPYVGEHMKGDRGSDYDLLKSTMAHGLLHSLIALSWLSQAKSATKK